MDILKDVHWAKHALDLHRQLGELSGPKGALVGAGFGAARAKPFGAKRSFSAKREGASSRPSEGPGRVGAGRGKPAGAGRSFGGPARKPSAGARFGARPSGERKGGPGRGPGKGR